MFKHFIAAVIGATILYSASSFAEEGCPQPNYQFNDYPCWGYGVNPPVVTTPCDLSASLDFLILKSDIETFSAFYSTPASTSNSGSQKGAALVGNSPDWDWGFEIAVGKGWACVPFEFNLSWMHYQTKHRSIPQFNTPSAFLMVATGDIFTSTLSAPVTFDLHLHFNQICLDISKEVLVAPAFYLKPTLGLDYLDLRHHSYVAFEQLNVVDETLDPTSLGGLITLTNAEDTFKNQLRGFGPSLSLSSGFLMDCGIRIEAGLKGALLWTQTRFNRNFSGVGFTTDGRFSPDILENAAFRAAFRYDHHILRPELIYSLNLTWKDPYSFFGPSFIVHAGWQGLFLFGSEETIFHVVEGQTFNLQGFLFGARVTF